MKKTSIPYILAIFAMLFATAVQAQEKADARYKLIRHEFKVNSDGTTEHTFRKEITLLRNRAITAYADKGETFIVYNPAFQNLTINECYTVRKDGSKVPTPKRAFVEQLPSECDNCGRFNGLIELAIVHTALEYDCTIVLDYTISSNCDLLQQQLQLTQECPVDRYEIIVDLPQDGTLYSHINDVVANVKKIDDHHSLHIVADALDQTLGEPYLPANRKIYPTVWFSNIETAADRVKIVQDNLPAAQLFILTEKDKIKKSGNYTASQRDQMLIERLRDYVVENIHTNDLPLSLTNYSCASPEQVWASGCGTPYEKTLTLAALLRQAGFYAYTTLGETELTSDDNRKFRMADASLSTVTVNYGKEQLTLSAVDNRQHNSPAKFCPTHRDLEWTATGDRAVETYTLPLSDNPTGINPAYLTSKRTAPVQTCTCDDEYSYTIHLNDKATLVNPTETAYNIDGLGSISISVSQVGDDIEVTKHLKLDTDIVDTDHYQDFRRMLIDWTKCNTLYLKLKR